MMDQEVRSEFKSLIKSRISEKIQNYQAESDYKPFFEAIFDKPTIIQASIMQSLYTSFGMSIYEQMAVTLASKAGYHAERQFIIKGSIDDSTRVLIDRICEKPIGTYSKSAEVEMIRESIELGEAIEHPDSTADVFVRKPDGEEIFIDITTVKPNKKESRALRRKFLVWTALRLSQDKSLNVSTYMGIPYNPYYPIPYSRSFVRNNTHESEVLVQEALWSLFAGYDVFDELLQLFSGVGEDMKREISDFLSQQG
ncbi:MAG: TdeIII family type II restriction endonuclease [Candidatus Thorarchaeota archaeon]|nr:TdeIII family type II restriction endonuclease [Candidatus Thorarchaeota archaeon]